MNMNMHIILTNGNAVMIGMNRMITTESFPESLQNLCLANVNQGKLSAQKNPQSRVGNDSQNSREVKILGCKRSDIS